MHPLLGLATSRIWAARPSIHVEARTRKAASARFRICENVDLKGFSTRRCLDFAVKAGALDVSGIAFCCSRPPGRRFDMASSRQAIELSQKATTRCRIRQHASLGCFRRTGTQTRVRAPAQSPTGLTHAPSYEKRFGFFFINIPSTPLEKVRQTKLADFNAKTAEEVLTMSSTPKGVDEILRPVASSPASVPPRELLKGRNCMPRGPSRHDQARSTLVVLSELTSRCREAPARTFPFLVRGGVPREKAQCQS